MKRKTILLTGATGFLGSHLFKFWLSEGHSLIILKRSSSSLDRIKEFQSKIISYDIDLVSLEIAFLENKIDAVVHLAAAYGRNDESDFQLVQTNTLFPLNLLEESIKNGVKYFINTSSSLPHNINAYSRSKKHFNEWLMTKNEVIHIIDLELEYFYGYGDSEWKFLTMILKKLLHNEPSIDFTSGLQRRDFIYIDDVINAYDIVLSRIENIESGTKISVGSGLAYPIKDVVTLCKNLIKNSKTKLNFGAIPDRRGELDELKADTSILNSLGWKCKYSLEYGLRELINLTR